MTTRVDPFNLSTAEKVEVVVMGYLRSQITSGLFGSLELLERGEFRVLVSGLTFSVRRGRTGWIVNHRTAQVVKEGLYEAARVALEYAEADAAVSSRLKSV